MLSQHSDNMYLTSTLDSYAVQHTHQLPSLVVAHRTPRMTPESLGHFWKSMETIQVCHPKPIEGWSTSFCPCLIIPAPVCVCEGLSTSVSLSPWHPPLPL